MAKLTKSEVDSLKPKDDQYFAWSDDPKGFGVKVFPTGVKSFVFQYRTKEGKSRRYTIGKLSDTLTVEQARKKAKDLFFEVLGGADPMGHKQMRREAMTVNELLTNYMASPAFEEKAESTKDTDKGRIIRHLMPLLGKYHADLLTSDQIRQAQTAIKDGKTAGNFKTISRGLAKVRGGAGTADKSVLILRAAYTWAISQKLLTENPAADVAVAQPGQRETIIEDSSQYKALFDTLDAMESELRVRSAVADAIRFIALTGARRGEVVGLKWAWVNPQAALITIPPKSHKTGRKTGKPRYIALPAAASAIIARQPAGEAEDYVFRSTKPGAKLSINKPWRQVCAKAKLPGDLVLHGLRHSIGTHLAMNGGSNFELMTMLGHKQVSTTQRYIHFAERARSTLAQRAASVAVAGMAEAEGKKKAEVKQIKPRKSKSAA